jgi:rhamnogalacturonyl hydrolase YesR
MKSNNLRSFFLMLERLLPVSFRKLLRGNLKRYVLEPHWFHRLAEVNTGLLVAVFRKENDNVHANDLFTVLNRHSVSNHSWPTSLQILGLEWTHKLTKEDSMIEVLNSIYDRWLDEQGHWTVSVQNLGDVIKGYGLLYLTIQRPSERLENAAHELVDTLLNLYPRVADDTLPYSTKDDAILVDSLGMVSPFLARYGMHYEQQPAIDLSVRQLKQFVMTNVDEETRLPFHGYYVGGPRHLGLLGWGRGVGWYVIGLVDTLSYLPTRHPDRIFLEDAFRAAAKSLLTLQRPDGHWNWVVLHKRDHADSSATAFIGYALLRGIRSGLLDKKYEDVVVKARDALRSCTRPNGLVDGSSGECRGLGKYSQEYGPTQWVQGATTAFAALSRMR